MARLMELQIVLILTNVPAKIFVMKMLIVTMNQVAIVVIVEVALREMVIHVLHLMSHLHLIQITQNMQQQHQDMKQPKHQQFINQNVSHVHSMLNVLIGVVFAKMVGVVMDINAIIIVNLVITGIKMPVYQKVMKRRMKVSQT